MMDALSGASPLMADRSFVAPYSKSVSQNETHAASVSGNAAANPKLVKAAHEFEASLMQELMKPLLPGHDSLDGDEESGSGSALTAFAGEALGKALSERGGLGIATRIIHQLSTAGNHSGKTPVPKQNRSHGPDAAVR
jgi:Rod binding domain-containing protein